MKNMIIALSVAIALILTATPAFAGGELDPVDISVSEPMFVNLAHEEVGTPENPVIDQEDLPKVAIFGRLEPGEFNLYVMVHATYKTESPLDAEIKRNGIGPLEAAVPDLGSAEGPSYWWMTPSEESSYERSLATLEPGTYSYTLYIPYKDSGVLVKYESEDFEVPLYDARINSCLEYLKGRDDSVRSTIFVSAHGRLPSFVWVSIDGETEHRVSVDKLRDHFGRAVIRSTSEVYKRSNRICVRTPNGFEVELPAYQNLGECYDSGEESPSKG